MGYKKKKSLGNKIPALAFFLIILTILLFNLGSPNLFNSDARMRFPDFNRYDNFNFSTRKENITNLLDNLNLPKNTETVISTASPTNPIVQEETTVAPLENPIKYKVLRYNNSFNTTNWGKFSLTVYYPDNDQDKPYPLLVFSPGFLANKEMYSWFGTQMAENGYIVLIFSPPNVFSPNNDQRITGFIESINYVSKQNNTSTSPIYNYVDINKIATIGHSAGALANFVATSKDSRIKTAIFLSPICRVEDLRSSAVGRNLEEMTDSTSFIGVSDSAKNINVPLQIITGSKDTIAPPVAAQFCYGLLNSTKEYIEIKGGDHVGFISEHYAYLTALMGALLRVPSAQIRTGDISANEQQNITIKYALPWLDYFLKGRASSYEQIFGSGANINLINGTLSNFEFSK